MENKVCPMDSFNSAFSPACPSLTFVPKGVIDIKGCPMDSIEIAFCPDCPSLPFVLKGLMESKVCPMDSFNTGCPACPSNHFCR